MHVRCLVGLAAAGLAALPASAAAATARLELSAPARVAAGDAFAIEVRAPAGVRVGAFAASVGYAQGAASISAALPLVRGGFPVGGEGGRVGFYGASGVAPRSGPVGVISFEPGRSGLFRIRIARATLYDPSGRVVARARATTLTVRVGSDRTVLVGRAPSLASGPPAAGAADRLLAAAGGSARAHGGAGVAAAFFARGRVGMGEVQALAARTAAAPAVSRRLTAATAIWTVTTTVDLPDEAAGDGTCATAVGSCSLRAAVTEANAHVGPDLIRFDVAPTSGASAVFQLTNGGSLFLTDSTGGTTIDGYSQPGSAPNTDPVLSNARNLIYIDSAGNGDPRFVLSGGANVFRGLAFSNRGTAIDVEAGGNNNRIVGNWFGFTTTGANMPAGGYGIMLDSTTGNVIGTPDVADRNVIGNWGYGTHSEGYTTRNTVQGNLIGIGPAGGPSQSVCAGTDWNAGAHSNQIGGLGANEGNHYSGGHCEAIELSHGYTSSGPAPGGDDRWNNEFNAVQGNTTGLDAYGRYAGGAYLSKGSGDDPATTSVTSYLYEADCINVYDHSPSNLIEGNRCMPKNAGISTAMTSNGNVFRSNIIGVDADGLTPRSGYEFGVILRRSAQFDTVVGNTIAGAKVGVTMESMGDYSDTVQGNRFLNISNLLVDLDNGDDQLGTPLPNDVGDADQGANRKQNAPVVTQRLTNRISGTSDALGATVEVYARDLSTGWVAPVGVALVQTGGAWTVTGLSLAAGQRIYAMQTATSGDSSECPYAGTTIAAPPPPPPPPPPPTPPAPTPPPSPAPPPAPAVTPASAPLTTPPITAPTTPVLHPGAVVTRAALGRALGASCPGLTIRRLLRTRGCAIPFTAPAAGRIVFTWSFAARPGTARSVLVATGARTLRRGGKVVLRVRLTAAGRRLLTDARWSAVLIERASFRDAAVDRLLAVSKRVRIRR